MSRATQAAYYAARHRQNRECRSQSEPGAERDRFRACEEYYARRALETTGDISKRFYFAYLVAVDEGDYDRAAAACDSALACAPPASHDYARAAFYRSETERFRGDEAARFEWLVRAAMADVQGAVRDYGALGGVAEELLRRGDAARAMRCIRVAINDTQAYNSPIRSWRDMAILPQIEQAYSERNARLRAMYVALILLAFLFALSAIGGVLFVLRQNRRLNAVQQTLRESNGKLAELAASLRETNADLSRQNIRIADANRIKEVYIGGFLKTISEYIYKLADTYRHVGRIFRDGRSDELRREYAGTDVRSDELKEFYHNFDTTFLGLFPSFIGGVQPPARRRCAHRGPPSGKPHDRTAHLRAGPAGHHRHGDHRRTAALFGQYGVQLPFAHAVAFARSGAGFRTAGAVHRSLGRCRGAFRDLIGTGPLVGETRSFSLGVYAPTRKCVYLQLAYTDTMKDFAAIDFETANGKRTSVCSVGVVVVRGGEVVDTFYRLIRPRPNFYSHFTTAIHGLRYEDTADAPRFRVGVARNRTPYRGLPLVAHNSPFDEGCLRAVFELYGMPWPGYTFYCTCRASRRTFGSRLPNHQAHTVSAACGFELENHHHALADAEACAQIALKIL